MFENVQKSAICLCHFSVEEIDKGVLKISLVDLTQSLHCIGLGILQKTEQQLTIHCKSAVKMTAFANKIAIMGLEIVHDFVLVFFFG